MSRLRYTASAREDLVDIAAYIFRQSGNRDIAAGFTARLRRRCAELAASPFPLGRLRTELCRDLRSFAEGNYVIFFRYLGDTLESSIFSKGIAISMPFSIVDCGRRVRILGGRKLRR